MSIETSLALLAAQQDEDKKEDVDQKDTRETNNHLDRIKESLSEHSELFTKGFSKVDSFFSEVTAPFKEVGDILMGGFDSLRGGLGYLGMLPSAIEGDDNEQDKSLAEQQEQTGLLQDLLSYFYKEDLEDKRKGMKKDEGMFSDLIEHAMVLMSYFVGAVGVILGGLTGYVILPFQMLFKALNKLGMGKLFVGIGRLLSGIITSMANANGPLGSIGRFLQKIIIGFRS